MRQNPPSSGLCSVQLASGAEGSETAVPMSDTASRQRGEPLPRLCILPPWACSARGAGMSVTVASTHHVTLMLRRPEVTCISHRGSGN